MHYAIVTETYPPEVNGVALTVQGLEQQLRALGHRVDVVRPRQRGDTGPATHELLVRGIALPRYAGLQFGLPARRQLLDRWRREPPDALYVATEGPLGGSALAAARRLGIPVATGFHTRFDRYMRDYGLRWLAPLALAWMRRFHNRAGATLVPTRELAGWLAAHGFTSVRRLPRGVDTQLFHPCQCDPALRAAWGVATNGLAVVHVGRIAAEKNLDLLVRAFRRVQAARPDARLVWIGDGPLRPALEARHPDFVFCGVRRDEALARHFASGDLFLFPSRSETFGNVTLEAMASGVPTVAFDYGAAREHLRDGVHGAAVPDGGGEADEQAFIAAATWIARDDESRAAMARAGRAAVAGLHPAQVAADLDALLRAMAGDRRDGPFALA